MVLRLALAVVLAVSLFSLDASAQRRRGNGAAIAASPCTNILIFAATA